MEKHALLNTIFTVWHAKATSWLHIEAHNQGRRNHTVAHVKAASSADQVRSMTGLLEV
jgi:hypothetical protein